MKNSNVFLFLAFSLFITLTACNKKETVIETVQPDLDAQILGKWQITSVKLDGKETIDTHLEDCDRDNLIVLEANGKASTDFGADRCTPTEKNDIYTWKWVNKTEKILLLTTDDFVLNIKELNSTTMKADVVDSKTYQFTLTKKN